MARSRDKAIRYAKVTRRNVLARLQMMARIILFAMRKNMKPRKMVQQIGSYFQRNHAELNPINHVDNYGVEQILALMASPSELRRVKSYYKAVIDAYIADAAKKKKLVHESFVRALNETVIIDRSSCSEKFDPVCLKEFIGHKERISYLEQHCSQLGAGASRIVLEIDTNTIIKIAMNSAGIKQNKNEIALYEGTHNPILAQIVDYDRDGYWLQMAANTSRVKLLSELKEVTGLGLTGILLNKPTQQHTSNISKNVIKLLETTAIHKTDLANPNNWSILNCNGKPTPILTEYGLTLDSYNA